MSRQLLILRHAKSDWDPAAGQDFDRPLAKRGKKEVPKVGRWLREQAPVPDYVVSSPAKRAKKTAIKVCKEMAIDKQQIHWDSRIYEAHAGTLLEVLADCPQTARTVLLVGHNPGLEMLLTYLCATATPTPEDGKLLPTASVARLELPDDWQRLEQGSANLLSITRPQEIPEG